MNKQPPMTTVVAERRRLGEVLDFRSDIVHPKDNPKGPIVFVGLEHIERDTGVRIGSEEIELSEMTGRRARFLAGDIVYGYLRPYLNKVWIAEFDGLCSVDQYVFKIKPEFDRNYVAHFLRSNEFLNTAPINIAPGQLPRIRSGEIAATPIPLPPLDEQRRIAVILDKADALRRKRKRALELLDGLTVSLLHHSLSNPGYRRATIAEVCAVSSGSTPKRDDDNNFGGSVPWVKTGEVVGDLITHTDEKVTEVGIRSARLKRYPIGTILVAMYGQGATRGRVGLLGVEATINQACAAISVGSEVRSSFLFHQLKSSYARLRDLGRGGNQPNLNGELVKSFEIIVPPLADQDCFVETARLISEISDRMQISASQLEQSFAALQHRAFSGQRYPCQTM